MSLSIGDSVKVMWHDELPEGNFTDSHRALNGREGKVRRVDTDGTALVDVDGHGVWLWLTGLEVVEGALLEVERHQVHLEAELLANAGTVQPERVFARLNLLGQPDPRPLHAWRAPADKQDQGGRGAAHHARRVANRVCATVSRGPMAPYVPPGSHADQRQY